LLTDLHQNQAKMDGYVLNPYSFVGLVCPIKSSLKGFEKRNVIVGGFLRISFCIICSSIEAEFSLCAPEDNNEINKNINFNVLVVPNSTCLIDSYQNNTTDKKCIADASNTPYCGIKLSNQNKNDRRGLFQRIDANQLIPCNTESKEANPIGSLGISLGFCFAINVLLLSILSVMAIKIRKMKQTDDQQKEEIKKANIVYLNNLEQNIKTSQSPNVAKDQSYEEVNIDEVRGPDWSYKYSIAKDPK